MIQIVDIDGDGSCLEAWCSLETVNFLFVPGAHSKLSWVSVDLTEVMKWRDGKRENPVFLSSMSSLNFFLNIYGVDFHESIYLPAPFTSMLDFHFESPFAIVYQTPMCHDKSIRQLSVIGGGTAADNKKWQAALLLSQKNSPTSSLNTTSWCLLREKVS